MPSTQTDRLYGMTTSVAVKPPCRVQTTAAITLSGEQTVNGVAVVTGDRVLVKDQADNTTNGIYIADTSAWSRAPDFDGSLDAVDGTLVLVHSASGPDQLWELTATNPVVIGTSALVFTLSSLTGSAFGASLVAAANAAAARALLVVPSTGEIQAQTYTAFTTAGTDTAYTLTTVPAAAALAENQRYQVEWHTTSGAAPTLARDGLAAKDIKVYNSAGAKVAPATGALVAGTKSDVVYDGTDMVVLIPLPISISGLAASGDNNDITNLSALTVFNGVQKRQTVLAGAATRVAIGTGLAVNLLATTTPVRVSFAGGTGAQGYIDRIATLSADVTGFWSGLTANVVNYLFYDRNTGTGAITGVASTLPYIAQDSSASISVVNGQHTYVYDTGQMYVGNGTVATAVDRTAEGECLAGASTITTVTSYARQGKYRAPAGTTIANGSRMSFNHNIGVNLTRVRHTAQFVNAVIGYSVGDQIELSGIFVNATERPAFTPGTDRLTVGAISISSVLCAAQKSTASNVAFALTDVNYMPQVERDF